MMSTLNTKQKVKMVYGLCQKITIKYDLLIISNEIKIIDDCMKNMTMNNTVYSKIISRLNQISKQKIENKKIKENKAIFMFKMLSFILYNLEDTDVWTKNQIKNMFKYMNKTFKKIM